MLFLVSTLLAAALYGRCQPWSSTELAAEEAPTPLQVIFFFATVNAPRVLALQQLPQAGGRVPATEHTMDSDLKPATLRVRPQSLPPCVEYWASSSRQQLPVPLAARNPWCSAAITLPALGTLSPLSPCQPQAAPAATPHQHPPPEHRQEDTKELTPRFF